jgi:hypothetical protein
VKALPYQTGGRTSISCPLGGLLLLLLLLVLVLVRMSENQQCLAMQLVDAVSSLYVIAGQN